MSTAIVNLSKFEWYSKLFVFGHIVNRVVYQKTEILDCLWHLLNSSDCHLRKILFTIMAGKRHCPKTKRHEQQLETSLLDAFSPVKLKKILPTSAKKTEDVLNSFRPNQGECLSYDISQTVLKMEAGDVKINLKDISATYVPAPPVTPKKKKKVSAPPYKFINEIWLEKQTALEEQYKKENRRYFKLKKKQNRIRGEWKNMQNNIRLMFYVLLDCLWKNSYLYQ